jgi:hypothetical protein
LREKNDNWTPLPSEIHNNEEVVFPRGNGWPLVAENFLLIILVPVGLFSQEKIPLGVASALPCKSDVKQ